MFSDYEENALIYKQVYVESVFSLQLVYKCAKLKSGNRSIIFLIYYTTTLVSSSIANRIQNET